MAGPGLLCWPGEWGWPCGAQALCAGDLPGKRAGLLQLHRPPSPELWLATVWGLLGRPRAAFVSAAAVPCEGLGLWFPCPEHCSSLWWTLPWGQPRLGCWAGLGWAVPGRGQQQCQGVVSACRQRAPSRAWCCRARAAWREPRAAGAGGRRPLWAFAGLGRAGREPMTFVPSTQLARTCKERQEEPRARLCPMAMSPACPPPATLRELAAAEGTPSQPLHGAQLCHLPGPGPLQRPPCCSLMHANTSKHIR